MSNSTGGSFGEAFYRGQNRPSGSDDLYLGVGIHNDPSDPTQYVNIRLTDGGSFYTAGALNFSGSIQVSGSNQITTLSGSVTAPMIGGQPVSQANPIPVAQQGTVTVTGSVVLAAAPAVTTLSGSLHGILVGGVPAGQANPLPVHDYSSAANRTAVAAVSGSDALLLAANPVRRGVLIYNDSTSILWVGLGTSTVTSADFTFVVSAATMWPVPDGFTGQVRGTWSGNDGFARVTELT